MRSSFFSLEGIMHTLLPGTIVCCVDHGGSGAEALIGDFPTRESTGIRIAHRAKMGPEVDPEGVIRRLIERSKLTPARIIYGVAAPVTDNKSPAGVHTPYAVDGEALSKALPGNPQVVVRNDYELLLERLKLPLAKKDKVILQNGSRPPASTRGVITAIGPGSGLGVGRLVSLPDGGHLVEALEGGHIQLPTRYTEDNIYGKVCAWWHENHGPVNADQVLCASGAIKLLRYLATEGGTHLPKDLRQLLDQSRDENPGLAHEDHVLLARSAFTHGNPACWETVVLFLELLGTFAQTAAFMHGPPDSNYSIYFGGGVLAGWLCYPQFIPNKDSFLRGFLSTREEADKRWLEKIPISILRDPRTAALHGAAIAAAQMTKN